MARENRDDRKLMISEAVRAAKEISELPKNRDWKTSGEYVQRVAECILKICEKYGMLPTVSHMASALGVSKDTVDDARTGFLKSTPEVVDVLTTYYALCENVTVASTMNGSTNNIAGIFILKSQYGYKEEPREVFVTHSKLLGERKDPVAIAQRYADAVVVDKSELKEAPEYDF